MSDLRTSCHIISADGKVWLTIYIYKDDGTADPERSGSLPLYLEQNDVTWPVLYSKTDRGFMTQELFGLVMHKFVDMVRVTHPDAPLLVFADRPQCHNSTELVIELFDRKAHLVWFPSNTSQVIQPLDGEPYANLKLRLRHERDDELLKRALCGNSLAQVVAEISPRVEREAFTEDIVKAGFKTRGVWPFDPDLIIERSKKEFVREPDTVSDLTNEAQQALTLLITEKQSTKAKGTTTRVKGIPAKNTLYTPTQLIQYDKERLERERKEAEEKEAQKKAKEEAKQKKKEEKEAKKREKAGGKSSCSSGEGGEKEGCRGIESG
jgi:hypothetical protein